MKRIGSILLLSGVLAAGCGRSPVEPPPDSFAIGRARYELWLDVSTLPHADWSAVERCGLGIPREQRIGALLLSDTLYTILLDASVSVPIEGASCPDVIQVDKIERLSAGRIDLSEPGAVHLVDIVSGERVASFTYERAGLPDTMTLTVFEWTTSAVKTWEEEPSTADGERHE